MNKSTLLAPVIGSGHRTVGATPEQIHRSSL